jgi:tRNA pseudouridine38-40 synthase
MEQTAGTARRIALVLQYDGTAFNGWQLQKGGRTVQGELERAIKVLTGEGPRVTASGRTDTGVHALHQVVHFDVTGDISLERIAVGLNGIMDRDVAVRNVYEVGSDFHARFSTREREYLYIIYNHPQRSPFMRYRSMWVNSPLDEKYLERTLGFIEGIHDFASFCKKKSRLENTVREIYHTSVRRLDDHINITIRGNAFLHNMIRIIIGTCVSMYMEGRDPSYIREILEMKDRDCSGVTAPPYGLYLNMIKYEPDLSTYRKAFHEFQENTE